MTEAFLHFIWKFQLFDKLPLTTTKGLSVNIVKVGFHNTDAGPDFTNAKINIGTEQWIGNVEIHLKGSDWLAHKHHNDKAYKTVILHVVFVNDKEIFLKTPGDLAILDLSQYINLDYLDKYERLMKSKTAIPCSSSFHSVDSFIWYNWLNRLVVERLERKTEEIENQLQNLNFDWNEVFFRMLAKNFGFKVNAEPFLQLAESLPMKILSKHSDSSFQIEALLYGQAGMLNENFEDHYPLALKNEYAFLKNKYNLTSISTSSWKYLRLMPANFPVIRISQFAMAIKGNEHLFSRILEAKTLQDIRIMFEVKAHEYWEDHSAFERETKKSVKQLGNSSKENIVINTVIPFLFLYGKSKNKQEYIDKALHFLEECPAENNKITRSWDKLLKAKGSENSKIGNALQAQASIELKNEYCSHKKCLSCSIGIQVLKN